MFFFKKKIEEVKLNLGKHIPWDFFTSLAQQRMTLRRHTLIPPDHRLTLDEMVAVLLYTSDEKVQEDMHKANRAGNFCKRGEYFKIYWIRPWENWIDSIDFLFQLPCFTVLSVSIGIQTTKTWTCIIARSSV